MVCICYQLANKTRNLLFDRTIIIGFVRFVANLLNRPTDGASEKVRPKKSYFSSACEYEKLPRGCGGSNSTGKMREILHFTDCTD
jgi:hypothetical protein